MATKDKGGRLRHRITIERDVGTTQREFGSHVESWETLATVWAGIEPISGREQWNAIQTQSNLTHRIVFRYQSVLSLSATMRARFGSRIFHFAEKPRNIDERRREFEVMAVEQT